MNCHGKSLLFIVVCLFLCEGLLGQLFIESVSANERLPSDLVQDFLPGQGIKILSIKYKGSLESIAGFVNEGSGLGMDKGIILSTGKTDVIKLSNNAGNTSTSGLVDSSFVDNDLALLTDQTLSDIASIEIEFIPQSSRIEFNYVFASEEYPEFVCSQFNDIFGFFITGPKPSGGFYSAENIALVPSLSDSSGNTFTQFPVSTNSVNNGNRGQAIPDGDCMNPNESLNFSQYYNDNTAAPFLMFDAYLDKFKAKAEVIPCQPYTIKMVIADSRDSDFDSAVFLEAQSLRSSNYHYEVISSGKYHTLGERCGSVDIILKSDVAAEEEKVFPLGFSTHAGAAMVNSDFHLSKEFFLLEPGDLADTVRLVGIMDDRNESEEFIYFLHDVGGCVLDTTIISIVDAFDFGLPSTSESINLCQGEDVSQILVNKDSVLEFHSQSTHIAENISSHQIMSRSLYVQGIPPSHKGLATLSMAHIEVVGDTPVEDFTWRLQTPGRKPILIDTEELTRTGQGPDELNYSIDLYKYLNEVSGNGNNVSQLVNGLNCELNGRWVLEAIPRIADSLIQLEFSWTLSIFRPNLVEYTFLDLNGDAYGPDMLSTDTIVVKAVTESFCQAFDTLILDYIEEVQTPGDLHCSIPDRDVILFEWGKPLPGKYFEVRTLGDWVIDSTGSFEENGLSPEQLVTIEIVAVDRGCRSSPAELTCSAPLAFLRI